MCILTMLRAKMTKIRTKVMHRCRGGGVLTSRGGDTLEVICGATGSDRSAASDAEARVIIPGVQALTMMNNQMIANATRNKRRIESKFAVHLYFP